MTPQRADGADLVIGRTIRATARRNAGAESLAIFNIRLPTGYIFDVMRINQPFFNLPFLKNLKDGIQYTPVDSMATVRIWHCRSESASLSKSTVNVDISHRIFHQLRSLPTGWRTADPGKKRKGFRVPGNFVHRNATAVDK